MLKDYCIENTDSNNRFVGIKYLNGKPVVFFPRGFNISDDDNEIRRDIFRLLGVIREVSKHNDGNNIDNGDGNTSNIPPIYDYLYIMRDFLSNGYYTEKETKYVEGIRGKINWKRTIQLEKPMFDNENIIYLKYQIRTNRMNSNNFITLIHKYCVYKCFLKFGWLFMSNEFIPHKPEIKVNKSVFISVIKKEINSTFNDNKKKLFSSMIKVIEDITESHNYGESDIGVNKFENIWEKMIDYVFGEENKKEYFPNSNWKIIQSGEIVGNSKLEPDTIMKHGEKLYVLDAKYYKYGLTGDPKDLPMTSSIQKQITYGKYVESLVKGDGKHKNEVADTTKDILNAFIMPFNGGKEERIKFVSVATSSWVDYNDKTPYFNYILGILLDTKYLISCYSKHNVEKIVELSDAIDEAVKKFFSENIIN